MLGHSTHCWEGATVKQVAFASASCRRPRAEQAALPLMPHTFLLKFSFTFSLHLSDSHLLIPQIPCSKTPSTKGTIGDIVRRLGLLAPLTKQAKDWSLEPAVKALYVEGIDNISKQTTLSLTRTSARPMSCVTWRTRYSRLTPLLSGAVAPDPGRCSQMTSVRTDTTQDTCIGTMTMTQPCKHLSLLSHTAGLTNSSITETFHELVIDKVVRYRKDNNKLRLSSVFSDPMWTADGPRRMTTNVTAASLHFTCFASAGSDHDHTDASFLKEHGVWLGDWYEERCVVTSLSFDELITRYYESAEGGLLRSSDEGPHVNAWHAQDPDKAMWCLACRDDGREASPHIVIKHAEFIHESDGQTIVAEPMRRTVSALDHKTVP